MKPLLFSLLIFLLSDPLSVHADTGTGGDDNAPAFTATGHVYHRKEDLEKEHGNARDWLTVTSADGDDRCGNVQISLSSLFDLRNECKSVCDGWMKEVQKLCPDLNLILDKLLRGGAVEAEPEPQPAPQPGSTSESPSEPEPGSPPQPQAAGKEGVNAVKGEGPGGVNAPETEPAAKPAAPETRPEQEAKPEIPGVVAANSDCQFNFVMEWPVDKHDNVPLPALPVELVRTRDAKCAGTGGDQPFAFVRTSDSKRCWGNSDWGKPVPVWHPLNQPYSAFFYQYSCDTDKEYQQRIAFGVPVEAKLPNDQRSYTAYVTTIISYNNHRDDKTVHCSVEWNFESVPNWIPTNEALENKAFGEITRDALNQKHEITDDHIVQDIDGEVYVEISRRYARLKGCDKDGEDPAWIKGACYGLPTEATNRAKFSGVKQVKMDCAQRQFSFVDDETSPSQSGQAFLPKA